MYLSHLYLLIMYVFSFFFSFMVTSDNQIREYQLVTLLTLHQHFLQAEKVLPDSAPYLNGMYQAITMLHMNTSSLICRCKLTISQPISLLLEHMINVLYLRRIQTSQFLWMLRMKKVILLI